MCVARPGGGEKTRKKEGKRGQRQGKKTGSMNVDQTERDTGKDWIEQKVIKFLLHGPPFLTAFKVNIERMG